MTYSIYTAAGIKRVEFDGNSNSTHDHKVQTNNELNLSFTLHDYVALEVNDYIDIGSMRFILMKPYKPVMKSTKEYTYDVKFYGPENIADTAVFLDSDYNPISSYYDTPSAQLAFIVSCINRVVGDTHYHVGEVISSEPINVEYTRGCTCLEALSTLSKACKTEWWLDGVNFNLSKCEHGEPITLAYGKGLLNLEKQLADTDEFFTRLLPTGSTKNIVPAKYGHNTLQLPGGKKWIDRNVDLYGIKEKWEEDAFAGIFPRFTGTVGAVRTEIQTIDGSEVTVYCFKALDIPFNPNDYSIANTYKHVAFKSGDLNGQDFEANWHEDTAEWELITQYPTENTQLPGDNVIPRTGDKYTVYNLDMPTEYYPLAEQEFEDAVNALLDNAAIDFATYKAPTDHTYLEDNEIALTLGRRVRLENDIYFPEGYRDSRITRIVRKLSDLNDMDIEVSNTIIQGQYASLKSDVSDLKNTFAQTLANDILNVLRTNSSADLSDENVLSSLRVLKEIKNRALSRLVDDTAAGHLTIEGGITAMTPKSISQLHTLISEALTEDGETSELLMSTNAVETTDDEDYSPEVETLAAGITEESSATGGGASTLGGLDNVDDTADDEATDDVALVKLKGTDTWIEKKLTELPGGGSASTQMRLTFISDGVQTVSYGSKLILKYNFSSLLDGESTGAGTVSYTVNSKRVAAGTIQQGENSFEVTSYLALGTNSIIVEVTDSYGTVRKLTYSIEAVDISISSTFDDSQIFNGAISFKYTPIGAVEKTIHFKIDGTEVATYTTTVTNRQQTQALPAQAHGAHALEVYMTAELSGSTVESNHLYYALACIIAGNNTPVVAISYNATEAEQYSTIAVPYLVYDPAKSIADVSLSVNGTVVSTLQVGRTRQTWNYRVNKQGELVLSVTCGATTASKTIQVNKSAIDVEAETADLELYLSSMGRSNAETNKSEWKYGDISSYLSGFNWGTNGWIADSNGNVALRVQGDARVTIPFKPFAQDIRQNGKTIEFEFSTKNVVDYDTPLISCWDNGKGFKITAQEAIFVSTQSKVSARFKEEERVRISFVVSELAENRLIHTYINGVASGSIQYPATDSFAQVNPAGITIGSNDATIDIYNLRVYGNNLNRYQLLDNYIADMDDVDKKLVLYSRNQIYDDYGSIDLDKVNKRLAVLYIIGDLPQYKGDKKTVTVKYVDLQNPELSFTATKVKIDVQGTSSQYYPRKNYKLTFANGFEMTLSGAHVDLYAITPGEVLPSKVFCTKADFAESSGTHNTGLANYVDWLLKQMGILTVPQESDSTIRTTVYGKPIVIAHQATEDSAAEFIGKYNFNTDKGAEQSFGFSAGDQSWEFSNNTSDRTNFRASEYDNMTNGQADWTNDFEARYPDDDDANAEYEAGTKKPDDLKRITDWIVSCGTDSAKFKAEVDDYMDKKQLIAYWIITLVFGMVDQRAKNMFLTYYHGGLWLFIFYDNDTCFGINNEGAIEFLYNIEIHDIIGSQNVWNGAESALWNLVEAAFASEIKTMYTTMRQQGYLTYDKVMEYLNTNQSDKWCEAIYNEDGYFKYEKPLVDGYLDYSVSKDNPTLVKTGAYLYAMQGSREMHRKWWFYYRLLYLDSKYLVASVLADTAVFRTYTPAQWTGVEPKADLTLTAFNAMYFNVKWGSVSKSARAGEKETVTLTAPDGMSFNDTETIIYGASMILSLGDLSPLYVGTVDVSKMKRLRELIIGSNVEGYSNTNLRTLSVGNNEMLKLLNIRNCPGYTQTPDLSGCENIETILAGGSGITGVSLPTGGNLKTLELPASIKSLTIKNQPLLEESGFTIEGVANLTTLVLENTNIDTFALLAKCFSESTYTLERVRLIDVQGTTNSTVELARLVNMGGVDENGNDISNAQVTGICDVHAIYKDDLLSIVSAFPELTINYEVVWIRFKDNKFREAILTLIDADGDGGITEAEAQTQITPMSYNIWDGIEIFEWNKLVVNTNSFPIPSSIKEVYLGHNNSAYGINFSGSTSLEKIDLTDFSNPDTQSSYLSTVVHPAICSACTALTTVIIKSTTTGIGRTAFDGCTSLVKFPVIPDTCTSIGMSASTGRSFYGCTSLKYLVLGSGIVDIATYSFGRCTAMTAFYIKAVTPPTLASTNAFTGNSCNIYVPLGRGSFYKTATNWSSLASRIYEYDFDTDPNNINA